MRFAVLARVVVAAASVALVAATTLERRLPGTCSSSSYPKNPVPFCAGNPNECSGDGCTCEHLGIVGVGFGGNVNIGVSAHKVFAVAH